MAKQLKTMDVGNASVLDPKVSFIKFEGSNDTFFWRTAGEVLNADAEIIVPETHQCIFVKDGILNSVLEGGRHRIFDVKKTLFGHSKVGAVTVDLVFISKTVKVKVLWGTAQPLKMRDPYTQLPLDVRANGEFEVQIANPKKFYLELVGSDKLFTIESLKKRLSGRLMANVENIIATIMHDKQLSYIDFDTSKVEISDAIAPKVSQLFEEEYGLKCSSFTIYSVSIDDDAICAIEEQLALERLEIKEKRKAEELAKELERLDDKEWERNLLLKKLEQADKDKYYEVLKILGWPAGGPGPKGGKFCPNCGHSYEEGMKFCPGCGQRLPGGKLKCPECGAELPSDTKFCPNCGHKM